MKSKQIFIFLAMVLTFVFTIYSATALTDISGNDVNSTNGYFTNLYKNGFDVLIQSDLTGYFDSNDNETDPIYSAKKDELIINATNGSLAYLWGNHASQGYLTQGNLSGYYNAETNLTDLLDDNYYSILNPNGFTDYKTTNFTSDFGDKSTTDLSEGSNLYYTEIRVNNTIAEYSGLSDGDNDTTYLAGNGIDLSSTTFSVSAGNGLTQESTGLKASDELITNSSNGQTAYGWGDHSLESYLVSSDLSGYYNSPDNETDPIYSAKRDELITNASQGAEAYTWGDHQFEGYITDGNTYWDNTYGFITTSDIWQKNGNYLSPIELDNFVGIGTQNPEEMLEVMNGAIRVGTENDTFDQHIEVYRGNTTLLVIDSNGGDGNIRALNNADIRLRNTAGDTDFIMKDNGDIGINTLSPEYTLDVNGNIHLDNNLLVEGNVGIGTLNPNASLHVIGNINASGTICDSNGCIGGGSGDLWSDPVDSGIIPDTADSYSIGSSTLGFWDIYGRNIHARNYYGDGTNTNDYMQIYDDYIRFYAGGVRFMDIDENTVDTVTINPTGADIDFIVEGDTDPNLIYADAGNDNLGIGTNTPNTKLDVDGNVTFSGSLNITKSTGTVIDFGNNGSMTLPNATCTCVVSPNGNGKICACD